ncbi:MAG: hypothetical protein ACRCSP_04400, partial [Rhodoglobus sp.]
VTLSGMHEIPAGTVVGWTAVTVSVVDTAPRGGTVNGTWLDAINAANNDMTCYNEGKRALRCLFN